MRLTPTFQTPSARCLFSALFMWLFMVPFAGNAAGIVWSPATGLPQKALTATFNSVRFINGQFFAVGNSGIIISSSDGKTWNDRNPPITTDLFQDIGWKGGSGYVAVGDISLSFSADGNPPWNAQFQGLPTPNLNGITASSTKFVAVGSAGRMWNSQDGQNWTINDWLTTSPILNGINWNGNQFVAVGQSGTILIGDGTGSGSHQAAPVPPGAPTLNAVTWSNALQKYVAVGLGGNIWISSDASADTWSFVNGAGIPVVTYSGVAAGNGQFVAVGDGGNIVTSSAAGQQWSPDVSGTTNALSGVAWGSGRFVAVGDLGTVLVGLPSLTVTTEALNQLGAPVTAVAVNDAFQYKLTVRNNGAAQINNLSLTDTLPANVAYTAPNSQWNCSPPPNSPVTCTLAALAAKSASEITLNVTAPPTVGNGSLVNNVLIQSPDLPADVLDSLTIGVTLTGGGGTNFPLTGSGGGGAGSYFMLVLLCLASLAVWLQRNDITFLCRRRV